MSKEKKFPSEIELFTSGKTLFAKSLGTGEKYNPKVWALLKLFEERDPGSREIFILNKIDFTRALRVYFLNKIIKRVTFLPQLTNILEQMQAGVKKGAFVTYKEQLRCRGSKDQKEAKLEKEIYEHLGKYFKNEFRHRPAWRQFPANFFYRKISEKTRIGNKFWIDILAVNRFNQLSVIELKAGKNAPLDLFIQALDYGIFCYLFKEFIINSYFDGEAALKRNKIAIYCIADTFHPYLIDRNNRGLVDLVNRHNEFFEIVFLQMNDKDGDLKFDTMNRCKL